MSTDFATSTSAHRLGTPRTAPLTSLISCEPAPSTVADDAVTRLYLTGEIDMNTNSQLQDALVDLLEQRTANIVIDLSGVEFCGISGFALLVDAARAVEADGRHVTLVSPSSRLTRTWALLWPERSIPRHDTVAAATAAIRAR